MGTDTEEDEVEVKEDELIANTLKAFPSSMGKDATSGLRLRRKQSSQLDRVSMPGHRTSSPSSHASVSRREALSVAAEARAYAAAAAAAETDPDQVRIDGNTLLYLCRSMYLHLVPSNVNLIRLLYNSCFTHSIKCFNLGLNFVLLLQLVPVTAAEVALAARSSSTRDHSRTSSRHDRSSSPSLSPPQAPIPGAASGSRAASTTSSVSSRSTASSAPARAASWVNRARQERQQQHRQQGSSGPANQRSRDSSSNSTNSDLTSSGHALGGYMDLYGMGGEGGGAGGGGGLGPIVVNPQTALRGRRLYGSAK